MLHIDIPTLPEFKALAAIKGDTCVSLYVPTSPLPEHERENRIALKDLAAQALSQLTEAGIDKRTDRAARRAVPPPCGYRRNPTPMTTKSENSRTRSPIRSMSSGNSRDIASPYWRRRR